MAKRKKRKRKHTHPNQTKTKKNKCKQPYISIEIVYSFEWLLDAVSEENYCKLNGLPGYARILRRKSNHVKRQKKIPPPPPPKAPTSGAGSLGTKPPRKEASGSLENIREDTTS